MDSRRRRKGGEGVEGLGPLNEYWELEAVERQGRGERRAI